MLLKKFVSGGIALCPGEPDPYEHVASVLTNVTRIKEVRGVGSGIGGWGRGSGNGVPVDLQ